MCCGCHLNIIIIIISASIHLQLHVVSISTLPIPAAVLLSQVKAVSPYMAEGPWSDPVCLDSIDLLTSSTTPPTEGGGQELNL